MVALLSLFINLSLYRPADIVVNRFENLLEQWVAEENL